MITDPFLISHVDSHSIAKLKIQINCRTYEITCMMTSEEIDG